MSGFGASRDWRCFSRWVRGAARTISLGDTSLARRCADALSEASAADAFAEAGAEIAWRVALACVRERLVEGEVGDGRLRLAAPDLHIPVVGHGAFELHQRAGTEAGGEPAALATDPCRLFDALVPQLAIAPADHVRVNAELADSRFNLGLARLAQRVRERIREGCELDPRVTESEHLVVEGHPWHPMCKTRLGLTLRENMLHGPDLLARAPIHAVDVDRAWVRSAGEFENRVGPLLGKPATGYTRIPVHAAQLRRLSGAFPGAWGGVLRVAPERLCARSLLSLRTVALEAGPHLKLSLGVHTTSARRVVSPMSVHNGPRVTKLLESIQAADPYVRRLEIMGERAAAGLDPERAGPAAAELGCIIRDPPPAGAVVCAALGDRSPTSGGPWISDLCAGYPGSPKERARAMLRDYVDGLVLPGLRTLCLHGVALELHLQNTLVVPDHGRVGGFVVRDLGGIRIHRGGLGAAGHEVDLDPASFIDTDDRDEVTDKLAHCLFHAHMAAVVRWSGALGLEPTEGWELVSTRAHATAMGWLRERQMPEPVRAGARAHLTRLWAPRTRAKALFRMRLSDRVTDYDYVEVDNALARPG